MNMMMDLKEIIKWFIPCFHILQYYKKVKMIKMNHVLCLFLIFLARPSYGANIDSYSDANTKDVVNYNNLDNSKQSDYFDVNETRSNDDEKSLDFYTSVGRTFGRPVKKLAAALIPLSFQMGAASTWMIVAALVGVKTLMVALVILKLLLIAGAAKIGALFGSKTHGHGGWESPQKEIHLHIHGQGGPHEEHISSWNRDGATETGSADTKHINVVLNPYSSPAGPQTISTPYGNYVRIDSPQAYSQGLSSAST